MSITKEDLIMLTVVSLLNAAIDKGTLKLPIGRGKLVQNKDLRIREPSLSSRENDDALANSRDHSSDTSCGDNKIFNQKIVKKVTHYELE